MYQKTKWSENRKSIEFLTRPEIEFFQQETIFRQLVHCFFFLVSDDEGILN